MKVKLYHPVNAPVEVDREHADRILAMSDNGGWTETEPEKEPEPENSTDASNSSGNTGTAKGAKAKTKAKGSD